MLKIAVLATSISAAVLLAGGSSHDWPAPAHVLAHSASAGSGAFLAAGTGVLAAGAAAGSPDGGIGWD